MINEFLFFAQLIIISLFLRYFSKINTISVLYQLFSISLLLINLLVNKEIILFGIHTTTVEPYSVMIFWIGIIVYSLEKDLGTKKILQSTFIIHLFSIIFLISFLYFTPIKENIYLFYYNNIIKNAIYSIILSTLTFSGSFFIERKIFNLISKTIKSPYSQAISVSIGQSLDTFFYTIFYFYEKPNIILLQIFSFSYFIKLICITIYTFSFFKKNKI